MTFDLRAVSHILMSSIYQKPRVTRTFLSTMLGKGRPFFVSWLPPRSYHLFHPGIFTTEGAEHTFQVKFSV